MQSLTDEQSKGDKDWDTELTRASWGLQTFERLELWQTRRGSIGLS